MIDTGPWDTCFQTRLAVSPTSSCRWANGTIRLIPARSSSACGASRWVWPVVRGSWFVVRCPLSVVRFGVRAHPGALLGFRLWTVPPFNASTSRFTVPKPCGGNGKVPRPGGHGDEPRTTDHGRRTTNTQGGCTTASTEIPPSVPSVSPWPNPSAVAKFPLARASGAPVGSRLGF